MFEKALPIPRPLQSDAPLQDMSPDMLVGSRDPKSGRGGNALRAIQWGELTARLNAARDLRRVLRRDAVGSIQSGACSFGDAAATYFGASKNDEHVVNPVALEAPKASQSIVRPQHEDVATGDARE